MEKEGEKRVEERRAMDNEDSDPAYNHVDGRCQDYPSVLIEHAIHAGTLIHDYPYTHPGM